LTAFFLLELGIVGLLPGLGALEGDMVVLQDLADGLDAQPGRELALGRRVAQLLQRPMREGKADDIGRGHGQLDQVPLVLGPDLFGRAAVGVLRPERVQSLLVEPLDHLAHVVGAHVQVGADGLGTLSLSRFRDDLGAPDGDGVLALAQHFDQLLSLVGLELTDFNTRHRPASSSGFQRGELSFRLIFVRLLSLKRH